MKKLLLLLFFFMILFFSFSKEDPNVQTNLQKKDVSQIQNNEFIVKRKDNQSACQYGGFTLTIGKDLSSNGQIDEIIKEINFCNISNDYLIFDNIVSEYSRIQEIVWENNQLHLQQGLNTSNYKTPVAINYVGPNTNLVYSNHLKDYDNAMAFWYRFEKLDNFYSFIFNFQDKEAAGNKMMSTIPNFRQEIADNLSQINCQEESCFGGANAGQIDGNGYAAIRMNNGDPGLYFKGAIQIHEYTHSIYGQYVKFGGFSPCWLGEGTAHYIGLSIGANNFEEFIDLRKGQMYRVVDGFNPNNPDDIQNKFLNIYSSNDPDSPCWRIWDHNYSVGFAIVEALGAISGPDAIMMIWKLASYGFTFEQAFESVYGVSWEKAVPILSEVVSKYSYEN